MRYLYLLIIGIFSFVTALNATAIRAMIAIFLCGLLSVCSSTNVDFSVLSHENSVQAAMPFDLEGQEIAVPPIIREAPIDLQNSLADDFVVSRQTPYNSGRNEVLIVSPSTGTEQRFEINLPGTTSGFRLYQASFDKVSLEDPVQVIQDDNALTSPQIQTKLENFVVRFNDQNVPSEVILGDGTKTEFSDSEAVIRSAEGQVIETVPLSIASGLDRITTFSEFSKVQLVQATTGCESNIKNQIYNSGRNAGNKANALRKSQSADGKLSAWVLTFGRKALEDSMVASRRNQTLQEVACKPPVSCNQPRRYNGSNVTQTDLFQLAGGNNQQITIKYEFYTIQDRMEIYSNGDLIHSIPSGPGSTGGNNEDNPLSLQIDDGVEFLGIKLIGNEDPNTRWDYTISCTCNISIEAAFFYGFDGGISGEDEADFRDGLAILRDSLQQVLSQYPDISFSSRLYRWQGYGAALRNITQGIRERGVNRVMIIGHSFGADTANSLADTLSDMNIDVSLLVQIDTVGTFDDNFPRKVNTLVNYFQVNDRSSLVEYEIPGAININTTELFDASLIHTTIDNSPLVHQDILDRVLRTLEQCDSKN